MSLQYLLATEFKLSPAVIYLNHAAVAPWPQRTVDAVKNFAIENGCQGARDYPNWNTVESRLRERLKTLIHVRSSDEIALLKNTSEALSVVAHGLQWNIGDTVVISDQEFPSN